MRIHNIIRNSKIGLGLIPSKFRQAGFGDWSKNVNGYSRLLETAIRQCKDAAARSADKGLHEEYLIFMERAEELDQKLRNHKQEQIDTEG